MENYYDMLRVRRDATLDEIKVSYRHLMKRNHPDRISQMSDADERAIAERIAKDAGRAYEVLSDEKKREKYDRQLADHERRQLPEPAQSPASASPASGARRRVNLSGEAPVRSRNRFDITPENWSWYSPVDRSATTEVSTDKKPSSGKGRAIALRAAGIGAWALWALVSVYWWRGPLLAAGSVTDELTWWLSGLIVHVVITALVLLGWMWKKAALIVVGLFLVLTTGVVLTSGEDPSEPAFWLAAAAPLGAIAGSILSTSFGLLPGLARGGRSKSSGLVDSEQFITVGSHALGQRHPDISALISALRTAFAGREGVRVIVLPDRVSAPSLKAQAVVVVGADVHLIAIPPLGDQGFEISDRTVTASGAVLRNIVLAESEEIRRAAGKRVGKIYPYVVPTRIDSLQAQEVSKVTYARLDDAIRLIGDRSEKGLDRPNRTARRTVFEAMPRLLSDADRAAAR